MNLASNKLRSFAFRVCFNLCNIDSTSLRDVDPYFHASITRLLQIGDVDLLVEYSVLTVVVKEPVIWAFMAKSKAFLYLFAEVIILLCAIYVCYKYI